MAINATIEMMRIGIVFSMLFSLTRYQGSVTVIVSVFFVAFMETSFANNRVIVQSLEPFTNQIITAATELSEIKVKQPDVSLVTARGQHSSARLRLLSETEAYESLTASFVPSMNTGFPVDDVEIHIVKEWYQAGGAWVAVGKPSIFPDRKVLVPELLLKDESLVRVDHHKKENYLRINRTGIEDYELISWIEPKAKKSIDYFADSYNIYEAESLRPFELKKGVPKQLWLGFKTNSQVDPGVYEGKVLFESKDNIVGEISLSLEVLPIVLPEPAMEYAIYYHGRLHYEKREPSVSSEYKTEKQMLEEFDDMWEHGIRYPVIYQDPFRDIELFKRYLDLLSKSKLKKDKIYLIYLNTNNAVTSEQLNLLEKKFFEVQEVASQYGIKEIYVYGIDEAKGERLSKQKDAWERIQSIGGKNFVAGYEGTFEVMGDRLDLMVFARSPLEEEAYKFHSIGKQIFNYANPQVGVESPYIFRKNYGVQIWASGFDGAMLYAYQHFMGDGWNDFDHPMYRDHNFVYSASNTNIRTLAWEGFRAGVDDVRYITLLEAKIMQASGAQKKIALEAKSYLQRKKDQINSYNERGAYTKSFYLDLDKFRADVANYIIQLSDK